MPVAYGAVLPPRYRRRYIPVLPNIPLHNQPSDFLLGIFSVSPVSSSIRACENKSKATTSKSLAYFGSCCTPESHSNGLLAHCSCCVARFFERKYMREVRSVFFLSSPRPPSPPILFLSLFVKYQFTQTRDFRTNNKFRFYSTVKNIA